MISKDPSFYIQNPSISDPNLAPEGHSSLYVLVPVPNLQGDVNWEEYSQSFRDKIVDMMKERAGLTDIEDHIKFEKVISPQDWEDNYRVGYGACFNLAHNLGQMMIFIPRNKFEELDNMWLVGGGTNPGSGLPTIYESGRISAHGIMDRYQLGVPNLFAPADSQISSRY